MTSVTAHHVDPDLLPDPFELKLNPLWFGFFAAAMGTAGGLQVYDHALKNADEADRLCKEYRQELSVSPDFMKASNLPALKGRNIIIELPKDRVDADFPWDISTCIVPVHELDR